MYLIQTKHRTQTISTGASVESKKFSFYLDAFLNGEKSDHKRREICANGCLISIRGDVRWTDSIDSHAKIISRSQTLGGGEQPLRSLTVVSWRYFMRNKLYFLYFSFTFLFLLHFVFVLWSFNINSSIFLFHISMQPEKRVKVILKFSWFCILNWKTRNGE